MTVASVVITYNPDSGINDRLRRISAQSEIVFVVDNGTKDLEVEEFGNVTIIRNQTNLGIATAINQGILYSTAWGSDHICLFDQDSEIGDHFIESLCMGFLEYPDAGMIAANYRSPVSGKLGYHKDTVSQSEFFEIDHAISSGSLIRREVFSRAGVMRDDLFIDYVDVEFCERLRSKGYKIFATRESLMEHPIGNAKNHRIGSIHITASNHSPLRRYYMARNCTRLAIENALYNHRFALISIERLFKVIGVTLVFERDRILKSRYMIKGICDGILNRMGEIN